MPARSVFLVPLIVVDDRRHLLSRFAPSAAGPLHQLHVPRARVSKRGSGRVVSSSLTFCTSDGRCAAVSNTSSICASVVHFP